MELKSVIITEVHWSIGWNASQQANDRLKEKLGPELSKSFATLKVGNATYNWLTDTIAQWRPMGSAPAGVKAQITEKAEKVRQDVFARLTDNENLATKICQVPNYEEYIFYKDGSDGPDIIITGWGFHNFKHAGHFVETWPPKPSTHTTTIAFTIDGERQPGRPFSVVAPKMSKQFTTDAEGQHSFTEYAGVNITVIDDATQRRFTFTTADKDTTLEFDITQGALLNVEATLDGQVLSGETVSIDYAGQHAEQPLNSGLATFAGLTFREQAECTVRLRGEVQTITLKADDSNVVSFSFTTPVEPTPIVVDPVVTARLTVLDLQGRPMGGARYVLSQGDKTTEGTLDAQGTTTFAKSNFSLEQPVQVNVTPPDQHAIEPIGLQLEEKENNYVLQEVEPKKGSRWFEILMFILLLLALALLLIFVFDQGITELTYIINHHLF